MTLTAIGKHDPRPLDFRQLPFDFNLKPVIKENFPDIYDQIRTKQRHGGTKHSLTEKLRKYSRKPTVWTDLPTNHRPVMMKALKQARSRFSLRMKLEPLDWQDVEMEWTSSSGWPHFKKKGDIKETIIAEARALAHYMKRTDYPTTVPWHFTSLYKRSHVSEKEEPKVRLIWGYAAAVTLNEGRYAQPLVNSYKAIDSPMFIGGHTPSRASMWVSSNAKPNTEGFNLDWSSFDVDAPNYIIAHGFETFRRQFDWNRWHGNNVTPSDQKRWRRVWDAIVWFFTHNRILAPDGTIYQKDCGVPSGSWFTQLIDSYVNFTVITFLLLLSEVKTETTYDNLRVLGDDSLFFLPHAESTKVDLNVWAERAALWLGMTLSPTKCVRTSDPHDIPFLGFCYRYGYPWRSDADLFALALYPESNRCSIDDTLVRILGLWISTGGCSYNFERLLTFYTAAHPASVENVILDYSTGRFFRKVYGLDLHQLLRSRILNEFKILSLN